MFEYSQGAASRTGNRAMNQDRGCIVQHNDSLLIIVADGMGGHQGGELAAQKAMDIFIDAFRDQPTPLNNPSLFLENTMREAHTKISTLGTNEDPPYYPRTTCVVCVLQDDCAYWIHLGDSRLYVLRDGDIYKRTRDHTYIEELYQNEVITEEEMLTHPMRNYVTSCLGGANEMPTTTSGSASELENGDMILLCSDGMWGSINVEDIVKLNGIKLETAISRMTEEAERASSPHSDNVTLMGVQITNIHPVSNETTQEIVA